MELKPGYKQTDVGVIPEDWENTTVRGIASSAQNATVGGPFGSDLVANDYVDDGVPVIRGQNMGPRLISGSFVFVTEAKAKLLEANLARPGDLVFTQRGTLGQVSLVPDRPFERYLVSQSQMKLTVNRKTTSSLFFFYVFSSSEQQEFIRLNTIQTGVPHINLGILRSIPVQRPPLAEQEAIARALGDADALIESLEQLVAKKRDLKQGAMQELMRPKKGWGDTMFGQVIERIVGGGTPSRAVGNYWEGDIPWMTVKDFVQYTPLRTLEYITRDGLKNSASHLIPKNTLIISTRMALGKAVIYAVDVSINQDLKAIFPKKDTNTRFLYYWFQFNEARIAGLGSGSTVMGLALGELKKIPFSKPPLSEQTAIATILSDMDAELAALEAKLAKARDLKQGMMQELLTGRIRLVGAATQVDLLPVEKTSTATPAKAHNWQINEAVVVSVLVKHFGSEKYPLARKRCTKLCYLLHRHVEHQAEGYLKKAAGPYNPAVKYKGPEGIAQKNGYIRTHHNGTYPGFVAAQSIAKAEAYFQDWYGADALAWLVKEFKFAKTDELELFATVDMAMEDLRRAGKPVDQTTVKQLIHDEPEWAPKLNREIFSDANIARALQTCQRLFH